MNPAQWKQIQSILTQAEEQPSEERLAFIRSQAEGEPPEFLKELLEYYAAMAEEDGGSLFIQSLQPEPEIPETIGPYAIDSQIGEGGMGTVYLATQPETNRLVAVKIIRSGWHSRVLVRRFYVEYQALACLNHPNIASIIEAGSTSDNRQWFSMEYVPGKSIDAYCREERPTLAQTIALFLQVVSAVSHAHAKAIIH